LYAFPTRVRGIADIFFVLAFQVNPLDYQLIGADHRLS